jgi:hypothetical protein
LTGFEPATFRVTGERSNQLSYNPIRQNFQNFQFISSRPAIVFSEKMKINFKLFCIFQQNIEKMNGSLGWTRTSDLMINSHLLYQLSYQGPIFKLKNGGRYWIRTSDPQFVRLMLYQLS